MLLGVLVRQVLISACLVRPCLSLSCICILILLLNSTAMFLIKVCPLGFSFTFMCVSLHYVLCATGCWSSPIPLCICWSWLLAAVGCRTMDIALPNQLAAAHGQARSTSPATVPPVGALQDLCDPESPGSSSSTTNQLRALAQDVGKSKGNQDSFEDIAKYNARATWCFKS